MGLNRMRCHSSDEAEESNDGEGRECRNDASVLVCVCVSEGGREDMGYSALVALAGEQ